MNIVGSMYIHVALFAEVARNVNIGPFPWILFTVSMCVLHMYPE